MLQPNDVQSNRYSHTKSNWFLPCAKNSSFVCTQKCISKEHEIGKHAILHSRCLLLAHRLLKRANERCHFEKCEVSRVRKHFCLFGTFFYLTDLLSICAMLSGSVKMFVYMISSDTNTNKNVLLALNLSMCELPRNRQTNSSHAPKRHRESIDSTSFVTNYSTK